MANGFSGGGIGLAGIARSGAGELYLVGANTYPGVTTVNEGTVEIRHSSAPGGGAFGGTTVSSNATLALV